MKAPRRQAGPGILLTGSNERMRSPSQCWVPIGSVTITAHWPKPPQPPCSWLTQTDLPRRRTKVFRFTDRKPSLCVVPTQRCGAPATIPAISAIGALLGRLGGGAAQPARAEARQMVTNLMRFPLSHIATYRNAD